MSCLSGFNHCIDYHCCRPFNIHSGQIPIQRRQDSAAIDRWHSYWRLTMAIRREDSQNKRSESHVLPIGICPVRVHWPPMNKFAWKLPGYIVYSFKKLTIHFFFFFRIKTLIFGCTDFFPPFNLNKPFFLTHPPKFLMLFEFRKRRKMDHPLLMYIYCYRVSAYCRDWLMGDLLIFHHVTSRTSGWMTQPFPMSVEIVQWNALHVSQECLWQDWYISNELTYYWNSSSLQDWMFIKYCFVSWKLSPFILWDENL